MEWRSLIANQSAMPDGDTSIAWVILPTDLQLWYNDPTLMASRLKFGFSCNNPLNGIVHVGIIVRSPNDTNDGLPLPGPIASDGALDWVIRQAHPTPSVGSMLAFTGMDKDYLSEAKRKIPSGDSLLLVVSNESGAQINWSLDYRYLLKA